MTKIYRLSFVVWLTLTTALLLITGCTEKINPGAEENEKYDGPDLANQFEFNRTKDPATGTIPQGRLLDAMYKTEQSKFSALHSPANVTSLSWIERGPNSDVVGPSNGNTRANNGVTSGRVRAMMVDSGDATHKTVWIGGVDGGLWKTTDITASPATWTLVNDFLSNLAIAAICQDPTDANIMYFCTGESYGNFEAVRGVGVFRSADHGVTWNYLASTSNYTRCTRILCDYQGNIYLATRGTGVLRSTKASAGAAWTLITPSASPNSDICDMKISSTSAAGRLHITTGYFSTSAYFYTDIPITVTSGSGWNTPTTPFTAFTNRTEFACNTDAGGNVLYALPCNGSYQVPTIWKSTDGGANWAPTTGQPASGWASGQGWYSLTAGINPADPNQCIVGGLDNYKTTDGGATWTKISAWVGLGGQYVHADQHKTLWFDGGNKLLFSSDGGIFYSSDGGTTIRDRNVNLRLKQFYSIAIHPSTTNYFLAGAQDNGVHQLTQAGLGSSVEVTGGDGGIVAIDQDEPQYQYGSYVYNQYRRSTDGGATWSSVNFSGSIGQFINPFDLDNTANIIYAGYSGGSYLRWNDPHTGSSTSIMSIPSFNGSAVTSVNVSPYTANRVYFGTAGGRVVQVDNANGASPVDVNISAAGMAGSVSWVINGTDDLHLLACFSNYGVNNVWSTTDGGVTWTAIDGNLPDMPVRSALYYPADNTKAYIATETGVWETDLINGASTIWTANPTFPNVRTDMLRYRSSDRTIAAGTHGRGVWSAIIPASGCTPASVTTNPSNVTTCAGTNASFSVVGAGTGPLSYQWQESTNGGTTFNNISNGGIYSGATTTTLTLTGVTIGMNTYQYRCNVTGNCAPLTAPSTAAVLTVNAATAVSSQPVNSTICAGANTTFSITATGTSLTYQWQESINNGVTWTSISNGGVYSGATTTTLTLTGVPIGMNTYQYRCVVTGTCAPLTVNSNAGVLTVTPATNISGQPANSTICAAANTSFSVTATGTSLTYQWQLSINGGVTWNNLTNAAPYSGVTTNTLTITGATAGMNSYQYRCVVSSSCSAALNSNAATLTVNTAPAITGQPSNLTICAGNNAVFAVIATGGGLIYQWQESTNGGTTWNNLSNTAPYSGVTTASLTITAAPVGMDTYQYRCVVSGSCPAPATSNAAILSVGAALVITSQPANATVCVGTNTSFAISTTGTVISYQWQESTNGGTTWNNISNGGVYSGALTNTLTLTGVTVGMNNYQYRCVVTGSCPSINSNAATLTVTTAPSITTQPVNSTICAAQNSAFSIVATGTGLSYQWQVSTAGCAGPWNNLSDAGVYTGSATATLTITAATNTLNGYGYRCVVTGCAPSATSNCALLTVNTPVSISTQPSNATACAGTNASFSVVAAGTSPGYQWQESTNGGTTWNNISNGGIYSGATTATLTLTGVTAGMNNYQYRCVVSGTAPCGNANSNGAILTVNTAPAISSQPVASTICATQNTSFSVTATGTSLTYQWQVSTAGCAGPWNNLVDGAPYSGSATSTLTITGAANTLNGYGYRCVVSGTCAPSANSNCAVLTVNTPVNIGTQPVNSTVCAGTNTSFSVTVTGTTPTYQWQESTNGGGTWNNISNGGIYSGATTATLTLTGVTAGMNNYQYRCVVSGTAPCGSVNSSAAVLTVNTAPNITAQPVASTICATQNTSFSVTANGTALTYQWQVSTAGCAGPWNNLVDGVPYSGSTTSTLSITGAANTLNGYGYRCVVSGTCAPAATSNCAVLTVNTPVNISAQPASTATCAGANASFTLTATGTSLTYQWQESTNGGTTWNNISNGGIYAGATTATLTLTGVTAGMNTYQYRVIVTGAAPCGALNSGAATLTVNTAPAITTQPVAATTLCATQNTTFSVVANGTALTYQWQVSTDGGTTYTNISNGGVYSGATTATLSITGATTAMNTYKYRCVVSGTCAPAATSSAAALTVYTPISITTQPTASIMCATGTTSFSIVAAGTGPTYQWQESTNGGTSWNNLTNAGIYSGTTGTTLTLTGLVPAMNNYQYRCVVSGTAPCGAINSASVTLTVSPQPVVSLSASPYTRLYPGYSTVITATVTPAVGFTTVWTRNGNPVTPTGNTYSVNVDRLGTYTVVATIGSCVSLPASITIGDSASNKLWIFPSPNNGQFTISYYNPGGGSTTQIVTIYDAMGRRVYANTVLVNQAYQLIQVDMRRNRAGVYQVVMRDATGTQVRTGQVVIE